MANLVGELHTTNDFDPVASFICHHSEPESLKGRNIVNSLVLQLLRPFLNNEVTLTSTQRQSLDVLTTGDTEDTVKSLLFFLPKDSRVYVLVDALDECPRPDAEEVLMALKEISKAFVTLTCLSSRKDSNIFNLASQYLEVPFSITMANEHKTQELADYIDAEISRRSASRSIDENLQVLIRDTLTAKADGM